MINNVESVILFHLKCLVSYFVSNVTVQTPFQVTDNCRWLTVSLSHHQRDDCKKTNHLFQSNSKTLLLSKIHNKNKRLLGHFQNKQVIFILQVNLRRSYNWNYPLRSRKNILRNTSKHSMIYFPIRSIYQSCIPCPPIIHDLFEFWMKNLDFKIW